jgi:nucleotide-binding universal stress UspA family protein
MPGIIVGVDGSGHSRRALEWAISEAAIRQTPLTVLAVHQAVTGFWRSPQDVPYPGDAVLAEHARKVAQDETDTALGRLPAEARPPEVTVLAVAGAPVEEILRVSRDADMLVVGSRGTGHFEKPLLGSVSYALIRHSRCPVAVIPADST